MSTTPTAVILVLDCIVWAWNVFVIAAAVLR